MQAMKHAATASLSYLKSTHQMQQSSQNSGALYKSQTHLLPYCAVAGTARVCHTESDECFQFGSNWNLLKAAAHSNWVGCDEHH